MAKKGIRAAALCVAALLAVTLPTEAYAATDWTSFQEEWNGSGTVEMENDIKMEGSVTAEEGSGYAVNGNGHKLIDAEINGGGTVLINADIESEDKNAALRVDEATVVVNGDIAGKDGANGLMAGNGADVTVNGDVAGGDLLDGKLITDPLDPEDEKWDYAAGTGVSVYEGSEVTVNGDVTGGSLTITQTPLEDQVANNSGFSGGSGVSAYDGGSAVINGNVRGGDLTLAPGVDLSGFYGLDSELGGGDGLFLEDSDASVTVNGTVNGDGNVSGGNLDAPGAAPDEPLRAGSGIFSSGFTGSVTIEGNVTGGSSISGKNGGGYLGGGSGIFLFSAASPDPGGTFEVGGNVTGGRRGAGLSYYGMTSGGVTMAVIPESLIVGGTLSGGADGPAICGMVSDMDAVMEEMAAIAGNEGLSDEEKDAAMAELMEGVLRQARVRNLTEKEQKAMLEFLRQNGMRDNIADIRYVFVPAPEEETDGAELRTVTDSATGVAFTGLLLPGERLQVTLLGPDSPEYQQLLAKLQLGEALGPVYLVSIAGGSPRSVSGSLTLPGQGTFLSLSGGRLDSVQNGAGRTASVTLSGVFALAS